ncbi:MAG: radical SAM protein [Thermodesulfobacteriota bacterium]|nr:radical SAM protein [Thermodesulfobacteriota bacterium]
MERLYYMEPSYLKLYREGELSGRVEKAMSLMEDCAICPRECHVNRLRGETGFCETGRKAKVSSYNVHFGEEAPLIGSHGSGTIFISSCNLLCSFCQNYDISHLKEGVEVDPEYVAAIMIQLAERGCHNINFVTPTHVLPQILEALVHAVEAGLKIPLVYNSSGYDKKETIELIDGIFDIYMPDFKFWDEEWSERYCQAPDYRESATEAIKEMHRQVGDLIMNDQGIAMRGLLVRHLVMPDNIGGTDNIFDFIAQEISANTYVNVMDQYRPCGTIHDDEFINRRLTAREFKDAMDTAKRAGLKRLDPRDRTRFIFAL